MVQKNLAILMRRSVALAFAFMSVYLASAPAIASQERVIEECRQVDPKASKDGVPGAVGLRICALKNSSLVAESYQMQAAEEAGVCYRKVHSFVRRAVGQRENELVYLEMRPAGKGCMKGGDEEYVPVYGMAPPDFAFVSNQLLKMRNDFGGRKGAGKVPLGRISSVTKIEAGRSRYAYSLRFAAGENGPGGVLYMSHMKASDFSWQYDEE